MLPVDCADPDLGKLKKQARTKREQKPMTERRRTNTYLWFEILAAARRAGLKQNDARIVERGLSKIKCRCA